MERQFINFDSVNEDGVPESIILAVSLALTDADTAASIADWWAESVPASIKSVLLPQRYNYGK